MTGLNKALTALTVSLAALSASVANASNDNFVKCGADVGKINVIGKGEVKVNPDRVQLNYRVSSTQKTPEEARKNVEETVKKFAADVGSLKLANDAFIANDISILPRYNYKDNKQTLIGYEASRDIQIKLTDFALISQITDKAIASGINQIAGFVYSVEDRQKYVDEATQKAIADAKVKAKVLADGFDVKVGSPCALAYQQQGAITYRAAARPMVMAADSNGASDSIYSPEPLVITSAVEASFVIEKK